MLEFRKKKKIRKILYSPLVLLFLIFIFLILLKGVWGVYKKEKISEENLNREKTELVRLENRQKTLASSIDYLKTEQGLESEIRNKFRAVKENEKVVVIIDDEATGTQKVEATTTKGFWYNLFH
jgi:cell division protein FtsB